MKKIVLSLLAGSMLAGYALPTYVSASESSSYENSNLDSTEDVISDNDIQLENTIILNDEVTEIEPFEIEVGGDTVMLETYFDTSNNTVEVTATNENTSEISTITYNKDTGELLEDGLIVGTTNIETVPLENESAGFSVMAADKKMATMKINYKVTPRSAANAAALVWGVLSGGAGFAATGIARAAIDQALGSLTAGLTAAQFASKKVSANGYFQYTQYQRKVSSGYQYQNRSQKLYMRINSGSYRIANFKNSAWFTGTRPAY